MGGAPPRSRRAAPRWSHRAVRLPVFAALAAAAGAFPSFSVAANVAVLAAGGVLCWLAFSPRYPRREAPAVSGPAALWWLVPVLLLAGVELVQVLRGSPATLSLLADPALERYPVRAACFLAWLAGFWALVRR